MRSTLLLLLSALAAMPAAADPPDIHVDVPVRKGLEVNVVEHDIAPGQKVGWHIHHGIEISYVLSGALNVQIAGGPIRHVVKGDTFEVDRDTPHRATNEGTETAALLITYLKDKAGPLAIPVPPPAVH
ncbi:MAG TPA: cupin domain-containing protein [Sphingomicrobium sp.]|jgi:quercetin dioxygenase-like cupin family protein|nr:cupin domain-containing protein [Sphingomicrobium sp.]